MEIANVRQINPVLMVLVLEGAQAYLSNIAEGHSNRTPHRSDVQFVPNMERSAALQPQPTIFVSRSPRISKQAIATRFDMA
jgi:hypothetical protein